MNKIKDFLYNYFGLIILLAILVLASYTVYINLDYLMNLDTKSIASYTKASPKDKVKKINVLLPQNATPDQIGKILAGYGLIKNQEEFILEYNKNYSNKTFKHGEITINNNLSLKEILSKITQ